MPKYAQGKMINPDMSLTDAKWDINPEIINAVKYEWIEGEVRKTATGRCYPLVEQDIYANTLCKFINDEMKLVKGSSWRIVLTNPYKSFYNRMTGMYQAAVPSMLECQYVDKDGDVPFVVELEENVWDLLDNFSFTDVCALCEGAYKEWFDLMKVVDVRESQTYSPSRGEQSVNPDMVVPQ
jgi:hypothetical protein